MELTQQLECTQDLYLTQSEKEFPDQIGFLGICGVKYPVRKGPNKIGRDPDTCNIVLNLNSISRQHAVINILNSHEFMLMDLDSANKTKLSNKTLHAYIPHPLKNGDMVQFGQVFGVFRLLEEDSDLPMTQALDIPETPVQNRPVSKINAHVTTVPESPDVSDKDESFIVPSQPKAKDVFKSPNTNFIKSSGRTISIKPIGLNKINNVFWSSSKKSDSFSLQSNSSINDVSATENNNTNHKNIHEDETQVENPNDRADSVFNANTQFIENPPSPTIHNMETQMPTDLPEVCKIPDQHDLHINFTTDNKENDNNIFNAETQVLFDAKQSTTDKDDIIGNITKELNSGDSKEKHDTSNEIIVFDEVDQPLDDNFESQPLLPPELDVLHNDVKESPKDIIYESQDIGYRKKDFKRVQRLISDSSTDCEDIDIAMTPKVAELVTIDDDLTDCEDELVSKLSEKSKSANIDEDITDCEDDLDDVIIQPNRPKILDVEPIIKNAINSDGKQTINLEDIPTQVNAEGPSNSKAVGTVTSFEDLATQIIEEETDKPVCFEEALTQQIQPQEVIPFKMPKTSLHMNKKKVVSDLKSVKQIVNNEVSITDDEKYYAATQQIFADLCSQREPSPEIILPTRKPINLKNNSSIVTPKSSEQESGDDSDIEEDINNFVTNLSNSQIKDVVGVQKQSSSSLNITPKTSNFISLLATNENKAIFFPNKSDIQYETNENKRILSKTKVDLSKKSDIEKLPTRIITRVRKTTPRMQNCDETAKDLCNKMLNTRNISSLNDEINVENVKKLQNLKNKNEDKKPANKKTTNKGKEKECDKAKHEKKESANETRRSKKRKVLKETAKQTNEKTTTTTKSILHYLNKNDSPRTTRSRSKQKTEDKEPPKEEKVIIDKTKETKSHRKRNNETKEQEPSLEKKVRRSKRQRSLQKSEQAAKVGTKSEPGSLESSALYNITSESNAESSNKFKRPASGDGDYPNAKKSKQGTNSNNLSLRSTPARIIKTHYVLFTAFPCDEVRIRLEKLGAIIVTDVTKCTVVLTMQIKRTFKLLCAVGLGKPIVGPAWVQACADTNMIVDPWLYLIRDEATEKRFHFKLARSLIARRGFLKGYNLSCTPNVMPNPQEMKLIVECSGGTWKEQAPNWICISANADKPLWPALKRRGAIIVSTEFILAGVLKQRIEIGSNKLA